MAVVRRDILSDTGARDAYVRGVKLLKQEVPQTGGPSTYDVFVIWHHRAMMTMTPANNSQGRNAAHAGPFLRRLNLGSAPFVRQSLL